MWKHEVAHDQFFGSTKLCAPTLWLIRSSHLPDLNEPSVANDGNRRTYTHTHTQTHANKRCTQMVAQDTICFCWLAPRQLIKHGVGKKFIPAKPISKQMWLIIQIWIYPFLFIPIPWDRTTLTLVQHTPTSRPRVVTAHGMFALLLIEF